MLPNNLNLNWLYNLNWFLKIELAGLKVKLMIQLTKRKKKPRMEKKWKNDLKYLKKETL